MNSGARCILTHRWPGHVTNLLRACSPALCSRDVWWMSLTEFLLCHESQFLHPRAAQQSEVALWAAPYWLFSWMQLSHRTLDGWVGRGLKDQRIPKWLGWKGPHSPTTPPLCGLTAPHQAAQGPSVASGTSKDGVPTALGSSASTSPPTE